MDRTSIIALVVCIVILLLWYPLVVNKLYPPKPIPAAATNAASATVTVTNEGTTSTVSSAAAPAVPRPILVTDTNVPEQTLLLTNENARYTFTSHGGGLKLVELVHYPETVATRRQKRLSLTNRLATLNAFAPAPSMALLDGAAVQGDGVFELSEIPGGVRGVRAVKTLTNGLSIVKEFLLSTNYLVVASVRLENHSAEPLSLPAQEWVVGTATPLGPRDDGQMVGVLWYNGHKSEDVSARWFANTTLGCRVAAQPRSEFRGGASNVVWVAAHNQFFTLAAMPQQPGQEVVIRKIDFPRPTGEAAEMVAANAPQPNAYESALVYPGMTLAPNQSSERQVYLFAGPKEYRTLARIAARFNNNVDLAMGFDRALFGRFTAFFARLMLLSMNGLHDLFKVGYGWVIIILTILIKALFWPLTQASTRSMKRMQSMQPQMNAIREKYKEDPLKMNRKMMEFMKENKISPLGGCLPMLLQMPVFIGLYVMIQSAIELRGARFLWVSDLTQPDTLFIIPGLGAVPFFGIHGVGLPFNLLPLIMGATMLWQAHLTPPSPGMDPMQQKIMRYMPLMFMLFLYNFSAGLTLYWTVQNLLTILQTKLTRTATPTPPAQAVVKAPVLTTPRKKRK
jgi:YidC/Oxa1 family membrane protein insertase